MDYNPWNQESVQMKINKWKVCCEMGYLPSLRVTPYEIFLNYKEEKSRFTMEKPGRQHLSQEIKVNIINNGTNRNHVSSVKKQWTGHSITSVIFHDTRKPQSSPNLMHDLNARSNWEETSDKPKQRDCLQSNCPFRSVQVMRVKDQGMFQTETQETGQLHTMWDLELSLFCYKGHYLDKWWNLMRSEY